MDIIFQCNISTHFSTRNWTPSCKHSSHDRAMAPNCMDFSIIIISLNLLDLLSFYSSSLSLLFRYWLAWTHYTVQCNLFDAIELCTNFARCFLVASKFSLSLDCIAALCNILRSVIASDERAHGMDENALHRTMKKLLKISCSLWASSCWHRVTRIFPQF